MRRSRPAVPSDLKRWLDATISSSSRTKASRSTSSRGRPRGGMNEGWSKRLPSRATRRSHRRSDRHRDRDEDGGRAHQAFEGFAHLFEEVFDVFFERLALRFIPLVRHELLHYEGMLGEV